MARETAFFSFIHSLPSAYSHFCVSLKTSKPWWGSLVTRWNLILLLLLTLFFFDVFFLLLLIRLLCIAWIGSVERKEFPSLVVCAIYPFKVGVWASLFSITYHKHTSFTCFHWPGFCAVSKTNHFKKTVFLHGFTSTHNFQAGADVIRTIETKTPSHTKDVQNFRCHTMVVGDVLRCALDNGNIYIFHTRGSVKNGKQNWTVVVTF